MTRPIPRPRPLRERRPLSVDGTVRERRVGPDHARAADLRGLRWHPARRYVLARLLTHDAASDPDPDAALIERLAGDGVYIDDVYLARLRLEHRPPERFDPTDLYHEASRRFVERLGLGELLPASDGVRRARVLLREPRVRTIVESLLLVSASPSMVASTLAADGFTCAPADIAVYERCYFDVRHADRTEIRLWLEHDARLRARRLSPDDDSTRTSLRILRADPRFAAVNLPRSPASTAVVVTALGCRAGVDVDRALEAIEGLAAARGLEVALSGRHGSEHALGALLKVLRDVHDLRHDRTSGDAAIKGVIDKLKIVTDPKPLPLLSDLSGGHHTTEIHAAPAGEHGVQ